MYLFNIFKIFKKKKTSNELDIEKFLLEANFSTELITDLRKYFKYDKKEFIEKLKSFLVLKDNTEYKIIKNKPFVITMLGVNGVGKTTSSAKLAYLYKNLGKKVMLVGADTFRAGARQQLQKLSKRVACEYFTDFDTNDAPAIAYKAVKKANDENFDVLIIDTGGRLHNKQNLMNEIKKLIRVIEKLLNRNIDQKILVLDATQGQTAIKQLDSFAEFTNFDGVLLSKLDSFNNFGIIFALNKMKQDVLYLGRGETLNSLEPFVKEDILSYM